VSRVIEGILLGALTCFLVNTASAQVAPQRTWPELKEAAQERANRDAYPLTGVKPEDVREILSHIGSLDREEWAKAWSGGDVPFFVEHCEAVAAKIDVTRRWLGEQEHRGLSSSFDVLPERHGALEVAYAPSVGGSLSRLPA